MQSFKNIFEKYKNEIIPISIVLIVYLIGIILQWGHNGNPIIDCGREALLPQLILEGKILFKDIFAMYAPLPYQINAFLYLIFGGSLNLLQFIGAFTSLLIIYGTYRICRFFTSPILSAGFCIFIIGFFIFHSMTCINYIFPYAYAMIYSLLGFVYFTVFTLLFLENNDKKSSYLASLCLGFSIACKPEFLLCYIPFIVLLIAKKNSFKTIFYNILLFILPTIISWEILFIQGFTYVDLQNYVKFLHNFFNSTSQKYFAANTNYHWNITILSNVIINFITFVIYFIINILFIYPFQKVKNVILKLLLLSFAIIYNLNFIKLTHSHTNLLIYCWICLTIFPMCGFLAYKLKNNFDKKLLMILILSIYAILGCVRTNFLLFADYAIFLGLLPAITNFIYICYLIKNNEIKNIITIFLIVTSVTMLGIITDIKNKHLTQITTKNGILFADKVFSNIANKAIDYTLNNTKPSDTVLVLPEGPMINFITNRPTNPKLYHLIPNHIEALGEDNIIKELTNNPPDYIYIIEMDYKMYGKNYICRDYGLDICKAIYANYKLENSFDKLDIYKLKKSN